MAQFIATRQEINERLAGLSWEPLEGRRASRIKLCSPVDASINREKKRDTYLGSLVDTLARFRSTLQPRIDQLTTFQSDTVK